MHSQLRHQEGDQTPHPPGYPCDCEPLVDGLTRAGLVHRYAPKVRYIAERIAARLPDGIEVDDLVSVGFIGLLDAAQKYDASQGSKFTTYAEFRIRGAIYDDLRAQDWVPRRLRDRAREVDRVSGELERYLARRPATGEVAEALGLSRREYQALRRDLGAMTLVSFEDSHAGEAGQDAMHGAWNVDDGGTCNPFAETSRGELRRHIAALFETFPEREHKTLELYYYAGLRFAEIGAAFGVSEARVCQIHGRAMARLRELLGQRVPDAASLRDAMLDG